MSNETLNLLKDVTEDLSAIMDTCCNEIWAKMGGQFSGGTVDTLIEARKHISELEKNK